MNSNGIGTRSVKTLVLEDIALAHVFERHGIDYCCAGDETLEVACTRKGIAIDSLVQEIETTKAVRPYSFLHSDLWDMEFLVDYIIENHHRYCKATIPVLLTQLRQLVEMLSGEHQHLRPVTMLFERMTREIEQHMRKEEMILFPYIKSLASAAEFERRRPAAPFISVAGPIAKMEEEHLEIGQICAKLRALLMDFTVPEGTPALYRTVVKGMQAFIKDVHQHIHLENNMLFPRARDLETGFDAHTGQPLAKAAHKV
jgi:regulator of cell morphogenesis and NO signaling